MSFKKLNVHFTEESWKAVESVVNEANTNFPGGSINASDAVNEMVLSAKVDIKALQLKHADFRCVIRRAAKDGMELDTVLKLLQEIKAGGSGKKGTRSSAKEGGGDE